MQKSRFYIGWDVGGWNCDRNARSRDAVVILDDSLQIMGTPWRGNLRDCINDAKDTIAWNRALFSICVCDYPEHAPVTMAIDTPLGFPREFISLISGLQPVAVIGNNAENPYLYRRTERHLFRHGLKPLSCIKDMIGSQSTKGVHVLSRFAPHCTECGVWQDGIALTAIEAYPSGCRTSSTMNKLKSRYSSLGHPDMDDALICALTAFLFAEERAALDKPPPGTSEAEGWIWLPKDSLNG